MRIYTRRGDDGTTALRLGARVRKDDERVALLGDLDESQAALGLARAECERDGELDALVRGIERDLWLVMAEVAESEGATAPPRVTPEMVAHLEAEIDAVRGRLVMPAEFSVPGGGRRSAAFDFARTVVRRAERAAVRVGGGAGLLAYLNRLSDLCWALARDAEDEHLTQGHEPNGGRR